MGKIQYTIQSLVDTGMSGCLVDCGVVWAQ